MSENETPGVAFQRFLNENKLTHEQAAEALGVSRTVVSFWVNGHVVPKLKTRRDIAVWTGGKVPEGAWERPEDKPTAKPFKEPESEPESEPEVAPPTSFLPPAAGSR